MYGSEMIKKNTPLLILVATHKPCALPTESVFLPIHCGRAISQLNKESYNWMLEHTTGDDTGANISKWNPFFSELTAVYWGWKNYKLLGSPDRMGLCHYRRYFMDIGGVNEITAPVHYLTKTVKSQFAQNHPAAELERAVDLLENKELQECVREYLDQQRGYFFNMFVLPSPIFFEYCEFLFGVLFKLFKNAQWEKLDSYQKRMPGFLAERLTGGFFYYLSKKRNITIHETLPIIPIVDSYPIIQRQICCTSYLAKTVPNFKRVYSHFLSLQTHFNKRIS